LDVLVEPLRQTLTQKVKDSAVKQQIERNEELIRSALRAVVAVSRIPNVSSNQKYAEFMKTTVMRDHALADKFEAIAKEVSSTPEMVEWD